MQAPRSSGREGVPSALTRSRSRSRSTTSRARSFFWSGGLCGSVQAWIFCAIWKRMGDAEQLSGAGDAEELQIGCGQPIVLAGRSGLVGRDLDLDLAPDVTAEGDLHVEAAGLDRLAGGP